MARFFILTKFLFVILTPIAFGQQRPTIESILPTFEAYVEKAMVDWGAPGVAIAIVKDGKIILLKGFGVKAIHSKDPVDEHTVFPLVSVTKNFTATLMAKLVDMGKIHWDDKVIQYIPTFRLEDPAVTSEFTIRDLLSHRSGLPGFVMDSFTELLWSEDEMLNILHKIPFEGEFRKTYDYQNIFVGIAGKIIEKVMQKPLSDVYQELLFKPLHMMETSIGKQGVTGGESLWMQLRNWFKSKFSNVVEQHHRIEQETHRIPDGNPCIYTFNASRGINSSVSDLSKWLIFQLNNGIVDGKAWVSEENLFQMRISHVDAGPPQGGRLFPKERVSGLAYGMGWFIHQYAGIDMLSHMGGMTGVRSLISISPSEKVGIIILSNLGGMRVSLLPEALRSKFFDLYLGISDEHDWSKELVEDKKTSARRLESERLKSRLQMPSPAADYAAYVGEYENSLYERVTIALEKEKLVLIYRGRHTPLEHWNGHNFSFKGHDLSPGLAGTDNGDLIFGFQEGQEKAFGLMINLFREGKDLLFKRVVPE